MFSTLTTSTGRRKLMAGSTGFDLVVPSASFLERRLTAGVFQPLDKKQVPVKNLDPELLKLVAKHDPDNKFAMPYVGDGRDWL